MPITLGSQTGTSSTVKQPADFHRLLRPCGVSTASLWNLRRHKSWHSKARLVSSCTGQDISTSFSSSPPHNTKSASCPPGYKIRHATLQDADQIGQLNAKAFAWLSSHQMPPGPLRDYTEKAEYFYQKSLYQDSVESLIRALHSKQQARRGNREVVLREQSRQLRADLARLQGLPVPPRPLEDRLQRVAMQSWRRKRQFTCLVIEESSTGSVVASCILSLAAPDALLPPPFPTSKPLRLYCSNMAVSPDHRRKGLATAILQRCQRLGRLWGYTELWLHVDIINSQAQYLYKQAGFDIKSQDGWYYIVGRKRYLMQKLLPLIEKRPKEAASLTLTGGSVRNSDGVFVWDVQADESAAADPTSQKSDPTDLPTSQMSDST